jgi:SOS-response transcriptional repressor LexA
MTAKERLLIYLEYLDIGQNAFEKKVGIANGYISHNKGSLGSSTLQKIAEGCPDLNMEWLIYNNGEMLKNQTATISGDNYGIGNIGRISGGRNTYNVGKGHSGGGIPPEPDTYSANQKGVGVPYFDVDFTMGFDLIENDQTINPEYHIDFPQYNSADCWVNATGKSMSPLIDHGDKIALKRVIDWTDNILYGEIYAIVTDDYRTIKKVRRSLKGDEYLRFIPENIADYDEQDVHKQTIQSVYRVLGCAKLMY